MPAGVSVADRVRLDGPSLGHSITNNTGAKLGTSIQEGALLFPSSRAGGRPLEIPLLPLGMWARLADRGWGWRE